MNSVRLRKKPWVKEAILDYGDFVRQNVTEEVKGKWAEDFDRTAPLHVELGCGKGDFITGMALRHPEMNFIGIEAQLDVAYAAAKKVREANLTNVRILVFNIEGITNIFEEGEVDRFYINFCDPWPKARHAKRRLTHRNFMNRYKGLLQKGGQIHFKTDNRPLFDFSLEEFAEIGCIVEDVSFDLHSENRPDNIRTEYEEKFSAKGFKINRCEIRFE